jgi:hypothetical protein
MNETTIDDDTHDHPHPIVCTCGHAFGHHDSTDHLLPCTRCECEVYFTDWPRMRPLGFHPTPRAAAPRAPRHPRARKGTAATRWKDYRR